MVFMFAPFDGVCRENEVRGPPGAESMDKIRRATDLSIAVPPVICVRRPRPAALLDVFGVEDGRPSQTYMNPRTPGYPASGIKRGTWTAGRCAAPIVQGVADRGTHPCDWSPSGTPDDQLMVSARRIRISIAFPQCAAFLALGRRQPIQRFVVQQPVELGIGPQMRQLLGNQQAICVRTVVQHAGPEGDLGHEATPGPAGATAPAPLR